MLALQVQGRCTLRLAWHSADQTAHSKAPPDTLVPAPQVEMLAQGEVQCPISLDTAPLCPQITPCGHVFAFPSIMQHLITHGGDQLRKTSPCPLCYSQIAARELRMVRVYRVGRPEVGSARV